MYLCLNTSAKTLALYSGKGSIEWHALNPDHQRYSEKVRELLVANRLKAGDIKGVVVMQGKGSFSDTRAGVIVANLLLENLGTPVTSIETAEDHDVWKKAVKSLANKTIEPAYYAEPNITKAKK
jgi:tRNA A37 threonylcarbamoyladenosine modification protein TsaB